MNQVYRIKLIYLENGTLFQSFNDRGNSEIFGPLESSISIKSLTPTKDNQTYAIQEILE